MPIILQGPFIGDRQSCRGCRHLRGFRHQTILRYGFHRRRNRHRWKTGYLRRKNRVARLAAAYRTACPWSADWDCSGVIRRSCVPSVRRCSRDSCPTGALCFRPSLVAKRSLLRSPHAEVAVRPREGVVAGARMAYPNRGGIAPSPAVAPVARIVPGPVAAAPAVVPGPGCIVRPAPQTVIVPRDRHPQTQLFAYQGSYQ